MVVHTVLTLVFVFLVLMAIIRIRVLGFVSFVPIWMDAWHVRIMGFVLCVGASIFLMAMIRSVIPVGY